MVHRCATSHTRAHVAPQDEDGKIVTGCEVLLRTVALADPEAFVNAGGIACAASAATLTGQLSAERCTAPGVAIAEALEAGTRTAAGQLALVADETGVDAVSRLASAGGWTEAEDADGAAAPAFKPPVAHLRSVLRVLDRLSARPEGLEHMRTNGEVLGRLTACLQRLQGAQHRKLLLSLVRLIGKVVGGALLWASYGAVCRLERLLCTTRDACCPLVCGVSVVQRASGTWC